MLLMSAASSLSQSPSERMVRYHELVPLGTQTFIVQGNRWRRLLALIASAESPQFEGMKASDQDQRPRLVAGDGTPFVAYPSRVVFRLTASFRTDFIDSEPFSVTSSKDENDYLLNLKFRIVAFHGLTQTVIEPSSVEQIGVPAEMRYNERIYRVAVDLAKVPITDRVVFEVYDPAGARLYKFHLDLI